MQIAGLAGFDPPDEDELPLARGVECVEIVSRIFLLITLPTIARTSSACSLATHANR